MKVLLWVVALVPLAVFGIVAASVGHKEGMEYFQSLIWLIVVVALGLSIQVAWYLLQMALLARMSPLRFLRGSLDVMANTFSTASTAATIPITLRALERLGISRRSSQLTACIGTNFNNDGTALYQATAVLFIAQALGFKLTLIDQILIMLTTLIASVGAGGIPSGSFVTMPLDLLGGPDAGGQDPDPADGGLAARPVADDLERPGGHDRGGPARPGLAAGDLGDRIRQADRDSRGLKGRRRSDPRATRTTTHTTVIALKRTLGSN